MILIYFFSLKILQDTFAQQHHTVQVQKRVLDFKTWRQIKMVNNIDFKTAAVEN